MSNTIKVTLTMDPNTARSVLSIIEHALEEGDHKLELAPGDYDKSAVDFHERTKESLKRQVLDPLRDCFPPNVFGPADLIGWRVDFHCAPLRATIRGLVTGLDEKNKNNVVVTSGASEFDVHWGNCRVVV